MKHVSRKLCDVAVASFAKMPECPSGIATGYQVDWLSKASSRASVGTAGTNNGEAPATLTVFRML